MSHPLRMKSLSKRSLSHLLSRDWESQERKKCEIFLLIKEKSSPMNLNPMKKQMRYLALKKRYTICKTSAVYIKLSSFEITSAQRKSTRKDVKED